jgi:hypothetical protein
LATVRTVQQWKTRAAGHSRLLTSPYVALRPPGKEGRRRLVRRQLDREPDRAALSKQISDDGLS